MFDVADRESNEILGCAEVGLRGGDVEGDIVAAAVVEKFRFRPVFEVVGVADADVADAAVDVAVRNIVEVSMAV